MSSLPASAAAAAPSPATPMPAHRPRRPGILAARPESPSRKPLPNAIPARPMSRYGSSAFSLGSGSFVGSAFSGTHSHSSSTSSSCSSSGGSGGGSRSTSGSSTSSFSSTYLIAGSTPRSRSLKVTSLQSFTSTNSTNSTFSTSTSNFNSTSNSTSTPAGKHSG
ncbi:hypothetical protein B0H14DRAFT_2852450 [Mycena olivaceomarginata]|nr:hypothetical protein B0H14DRAFT_2852450 [Mycena olivaceomarginata]